MYDQQPIRRTVGRRHSREGQPLTVEDKSLMARLGQYRTRAPKGIFIYSSAEEMEADRFSWTVDAVLERQR